MIDVADYFLRTISALRKTDIIRISYSIHVRILFKINQLGEKEMEN